MYYAYTEGQLRDDWRQVPVGVGGRRRLAVPGVAPVWTHCEDLLSHLGDDAGGNPRGKAPAESCDDGG